MIEFVTNRNEIYNELFDEVRLFFPDALAVDLRVNHCFVLTDKIRNFIQINSAQYCEEIPLICAQNKLESTRLDVRSCKAALYNALEGYSKRSLPWGNLTGIRPTALATQLLVGGLAPQNLRVEMENIFKISPEKSKLVADIVKSQNDYVSERLSIVFTPDYNDKNRSTNLCDNLVNLYIHVPFCSSRCNYCSFVSTTIDKERWLVNPYVESLASDIMRTRELLDKLGLKIFSVYVGGGTPTALEPMQLQKVLSAAAIQGVEFTCEAGRPDTITHEHLDVMNECGVNRISVNPQTLNDKTLKIIGRNHSVEDFYTAYQKAKSVGFRKNVDLIAGLTGETYEDFCYTVNGILELRPENITVHTLSYKRGSQLIKSEYEANNQIESMINFSIKELSAAGYVPYYLYRQKQMLGNLENIGWSLPGMLCVNNITTMEETLSVVGCGAGAISKRIFKEGRIERLASPKDVLLYLQQFEERFKKKELFFLN